MIDFHGKNFWRNNLGGSKWAERGEKRKFWSYEAKPIANTTSFRISKVEVDLNDAFANATRVIMDSGEQGKTSINNPNGECLAPTTSFLFSNQKVVDSAEIQDKITYGNQRSDFLNLSQGDSRELDELHCGKGTSFHRDLRGVGTTDHFLVPRGSEISKDVEGDFQRFDANDSPNASPISDQYSHVSNQATSDTSMEVTPATLPLDAERADDNDRTSLGVLNTSMGIEPNVSEVIEFPLLEFQTSGIDRVPDDDVWEPLTNMQTDLKGFDTAVDSFVAFTESAQHPYAVSQTASDTGMESVPDAFDEINLPSLDSLVSTDSAQLPYAVSQSASDTNMESVPDAFDETSLPSYDSLASDKDPFVQDIFFNPWL